jgi:glycosyltransferase involved in cell wall biosynthesis
MEAWAARRPVVSTSVGAEGLPVESGKNIVLANSPQDWMEQVLKLLEDEEERKRLGAAGRDVFERELSWPAAWRRLDEALQPLLGPIPAAAAS